MDLLNTSICRTDVTTGSSTNSVFFSVPFRFHRAAFYSQLKSKVDNIFTKATVLRINLNIDDAPIDSHTHTHPSHSQTSHLLFTFLSLGTPFPRSP